MGGLPEIVLLIYLVLRTLKKLKQEDSSLCHVIQPYVMKNNAA